MTKDNSTGKNKDFYDLGKKKFDQIRVLPEHQAIPQIPQERSSKYMTVFELIEANGLTLHGDIEHFAELVAAAATEAANARANTSWALMCKKMVAAEKEVCAKQLDALGCDHCAAAIRARGQA